MRSGHTEAAVDLCQLAEIEPVAAICELVNDDGTVMRGKEVAAFATKHKLKRIAVADLIAYRQAREKLVTRVAEFKVRVRDRRVHRLRLCDAVRQGASLRLRLRQDRRRARRADPAAPRQRRRGRVRRRQADPRFVRALQGGRARRARLSARRRVGRADPRDRRGRPHPNSSAASSGARSGSARKSCAICRSARSACCDPRAHLCRARRVRHRDRRDRAVGGGASLRLVVKDARPPRGPGDC